MAKKVRRVKKQRSQNKQATPAPEETIPEAPAESQISSTDQFRLEYAYVVKDLRRVLILAAFMFALLIALNLLLQ